MTGPGSGPTAPAVRTRAARTGTVRTAATALGVLVAVTVVTWLRLGPTARDTLWAEDATRFLQEEQRYGLLGALGRPYAGYLHAVPRLLAAVDLEVAGLPTLARTVTGTSCLVAGAVAAGITVLAAPWVRSSAVRVVMGLSLALVPDVPAETAGNLANLHSYLLVLSPFLLLRTPRTRAGAALAALVAALVTFTEIQAVLFLPLLLLDRRDRHRWAMAACAVAGVAAQVVTTLLHPRPRPPYDVVPTEVAYGYLTMPLPQSVSSHTQVVHRLVTDHRVAYVVVAVLLLALLVALVVVRCRGRQRLLALSLLAGSGLTWAAALVLNPRPDFDFTRWSAADYAGLTLARYTTVSSLLLVLAVLVVVDALLDGRGSRVGRRGRTARAGRVLAGAVVLAVVSGWLTGLDVPSVRQQGPTVTSQLPGLVSRCEGADPDVQVRVAAAPPARSPWSLALPCADVLDGTSRSAS